MAEHLQDLADAQVTDVELKALQDKIDDYNGYAGKPRQKRTENTAAVAPEFFRAYMAARKIVDNAAGHNAKNGDNQPPQPPQ